jgi:hypothetical protein
VQDHDGGADPATPHRSHEHEVVFPKPLYSRQQVNKAGEEIEAVLVATGPIEALKKAYPNYFLDRANLSCESSVSSSKRRLHSEGKKLTSSPAPAERRCD